MEGHKGNSPGELGWNQTAGPSRRVRARGLCSARTVGGRACGTDPCPRDWQEAILLAARAAAGVLVVNHNDSNLGAEEHFVAFNELPSEPCKRHSEELIGSLTHSIREHVLDPRQ